MHWISPVVGCPGCVDYNLKIYGRFARTQIPHSNGWSKGNIFIDLDSGFFHLNFTVSAKIVLYEQTCNEIYTYVDEYMYHAKTLIPQMSSKQSFLADDLQTFPFFRTQHQWWQKFTPPWDENSTRKI